MARRFGRLIECVSSVLPLALIILTGSARIQSQTKTGTGGEIRSLRTKDAERLPVSSLISGPTLGWVFDQVNAGLRPILGIPGASLFGNVVELDVEISRAWISPQQDYALVESTRDGEIFLLHLESEPIAVAPIPGVTHGANHIALSSTGASAVVYDRSRHKIQFLTGLQSVPSVIGEVDTSTLPGTLSAVTVSDDASVALMAVSQGEKGSVYVIGRHGNIWWLADLGQASDICFLRDGQDALIADHGANEIVLIRDITGAATKLTFASEQDEISQPIAVRVSDDNRRVFILNSGSATVLVLDFESGLMSQLSSRGVSSGLHRLRGTSVFRLNELSGSALLLLDGGSKQPRILFVPPPS